MPFVAAQQRNFRRLVAVAWDPYAAREGLAKNDRKALEVFTKNHLEKATGKRSTKDCNNSRDFDAAMAHFEALAQNGEYEWNMNLIQGDAKRARHSVQKVNPRFLSQFPTQLDFERYLQGCARKLIHSSELPKLHELDNSQMADVTAMACRSAKYWSEEKDSQTIGNSANPF